LTALAFFTSLEAVTLVVEKLQSLTEAGLRSGRMLSYRERTFSALSSLLSG